MLNNNNIIFPYYSGNIKFSKSLGFVNLNHFIYSIQNPKPEIMILFEEIEQASIQGDDKLKRALKHKLFSFTPTAIIQKGLKRSYSKVYDWNPLMQIDLDKLPDFETGVKLKNYIFDNYKQIVCIFFSPSRKGIKALMRIKKPKSKEHFKALHKAVSTEFEQFGYFDDATKNAMLPLFLSYDTDIYWRNFEDCDEWVKEDWSKPEYVNLNNVPTNTDYIKDISKYTKKVIKLTTDRIQGIIDNGHPQVRTTALILGSRVCAGYISESDAKDLILNLVRSNNYLQKDLNNYISTSLWGIREGMKQPKYF